MLSICIKGLMIIIIIDDDRSSTEYDLFIDDLNCMIMDDFKEKV